MMTFDEYQIQAKVTDVTVGQGSGLMSISFMDKVLGLAGESGEFADKIKKLLRDKNAKLDEPDRLELVKELGDILWYVAILADYINEPLQSVAEKNVTKLSHRYHTGTLKGSGDNR